MASYSRFESAASEGDIKSAYADLLNDIRHTLNLLEDLEMERTWGELVTDWAAGDRNKLNIPRVRKQLNILKEEVGKGSKLFTTIFLKLRGFECFEKYYFHKTEMISTTFVGNTYSNETAKNFKESLKSLFERFSEVTKQLGETGIFKPQREGMISSIFKDSSMGAAFLVLTPGVDITVLLSYVAYRYAKSKGINRGVKYQELQFLSDSLNNPQLLSIFQTCHSSLQETIDGIDEMVETFRSHFSTETEINKPNSSEKAHIQAMKFYQQEKGASLLSLEVDEPDLSPAMRTKMAIRISKAACKVLLIEKLDYSESDAKELIDCLDA